MLRPEKNEEVDKAVIRKVPGFSLIEMALVLIIIGLISGLTLPTIKVMLDWHRTKITALHQDQILYALASYVNKNGILPYAANPMNQDGFQETRRRRGIVPFVDLGLPQSIAKDGYQRWFTYVVDDFYSNTSKSAIPQPGTNYFENKLCKEHEAQNAVRIRGVPEKIAVVLISHGPKGRGAFPNPSTNPPQGGDEQQNSQSDQEIIDRPVSQDPSNPFSHKVVWVTARNLMAIYAHAPCLTIRVGKPVEEKLFQKPPPKEDLFQKPRGTKTEGLEGWLK